MLTRGPPTECCSPRPFPGQDSTRVRCRCAVDAQAGPLRYRHDIASGPYPKPANRHPGVPIRRLRGPHCLPTQHLHLPTDERRCRLATSEATVEQKSTTSPRLEPFRSQDALASSACWAHPFSVVATRASANQSQALPERSIHPLQVKEVLRNDDAIRNVAAEQ